MLLLLSVTAMNTTENNKTSAVIQYFADRKITKTQFLMNNGSSKWPDTIMDYLSTMLFVEGSTRTRYPAFHFSTDYSNYTVTPKNIQADAQCPDGQCSMASWFRYYAVKMFQLLSFRVAPEQLCRIYGNRSP